MKRPTTVILCVYWGRHQLESVPAKCCSCDSMLAVNKPNFHWVMSGKVTPMCVKCCAEFTHTGEITFDEACVLIEGEPVMLQQDTAKSIYAQVLRKSADRN